MTGFLNNYSDRSARAIIGGLFEELMLPIPEQHEHISRTNASIVLCQDFGFVIKIGSPTVPHVRFEHYVRPLLSYRINERLRFDVKQAGPLVSAKDTEIIFDKFQEQGVDARDVVYRGINTCSGGNSLYFSIKTAEFPRGLPATFDPSEFKYEGGRPLPEFDSFLDKDHKFYDFRPGDMFDPDIQDMEYGYLRDMFAASVLNKGIVSRLKEWCGDRPVRLEAKYVRQFMQACSDAVQSGHIVPPWPSFKDHHKDNLRELSVVSQKYSDRVREVNPIAASLAL